MSHFPRCLSWRLAAWVVLSLFAWTGRSQAQQPPRSEVLVEVTRGSLVESRHHGQLVAVNPEGRVLLAVGDPHTPVFPRSSLKPLQALATVALAIEQGIELPTEEIAILCASHAGHDYHVAAVQQVLQRAQAEDRHLYCGAGSDLHATHGCSGKHSGMLLQASLSGAPLEGYWKVDHPVQRRIQQAIGEFTDYRETLAWGTDGCGVPNYALPLDRLALGFARLGDPPKSCL